MSILSKLSFFLWIFFSLFVEKSQANQRCECLSISKSPETPTTARYTVRCYKKGSMTLISERNIEKGQDYEKWIEPLKRRYSSFRCLQGLRGIVSKVPF